MSSHHKNTLEPHLHSGKCHWLWHFLSMILVALVMAACAPGTGGTGTGPITSSASLSSTDNFSFVGSTLSIGEAPIFIGTVSSFPSITQSFAGLSPCIPSANPTLPSLLLSDQHIQYQADCYAFRYQGSWDLGSTLVLTVKGTIFNINEPELQQPALLTLAASSSLNSESVTVRVTLADTTGLTSLPTQVLLPTK
jgi:hypothetical protein